jgi:predicted DCC family thiol-disulfide oxidoreductase YuxK
MFPMAGASPSPPDPAGWVLFDAGCGICARWVPAWSPTFRKLGLATAPLGEPWVAERTGLPPEELLRDFAILLADGSLLRGGDAYRWILRREWWGWPLWLAASLPPGRQLFDLAYRTFARNRRRLSRVCRLEPPLPSRGGEKLPEQ